MGGTGAANPTFAIGGSAFLKPCFDAYRAEAPGEILTLTAGDAIGATPPISAFFGDKPTIEFMNLMGFDLDGLGNHNFDRGEAYFRNEIVPLAAFDYLSANIVDDAGKTPPEWAKSKVFTIEPGLRVGFVGFSNPDIPELTKPGSLGPFHVADPVAAVNDEARQMAQAAEDDRGRSSPSATWARRPGRSRSRPARAPTSLTRSTTSTSSWATTRTSR